MEKKMSFGKGILAMIGALTGEMFGLLLPALFLLCILMGADYISGMLASKKEALEHPENKEYGWSSKKSVLGIYKKVGYILTILAAVCTDYLLIELAEELSLAIPVNTMFGLLVAVWFIINELLSILENAGRMGVALPKFLVRLLTELSDKVNE